MMQSLVVIAMSSALVVQSPRGESELELDGASVSIEYGRPSLKGRDLLALLPIGHTWRLGADAATTIITSHDLEFGGVEIPKGSYSLFLKRSGERAWELVFNTEIGQWGTQQDVTMDFARVPLKSTEGKEPVEELTIEFHDTELRIRWGKDVLMTTLARH